MISLSFQDPAGAEMENGTANNNGMGRVEELQNGNNLRRGSTQ